MDKLFGTNFIGSERYVRVMKRKLLKKNEQKNEQKIEQTRAEKRME